MSDNTSVTPTRRDEHVADTRQALVDAARKLFTEQGFAATGTEEIVAAARVTRGALYHHFHDKTDLFRAVMEQIAREVAEHLIDAELSRPHRPRRHRYSRPPTPGTKSVTGCARSSICALVTDDFQRIVLVEGAAVLGHEAWDNLVARHGSNLLAEWLSRAVELGRIAPLPIQPLTRLLIAMISESSLYIARAEDRPAAREAMGAVLDRLLPTGLEPPPSVSHLPRRPPGASPRRRFRPGQLRALSHRLCSHWAWLSVRSVQYHCLPIWPGRSSRPPGRRGPRSAHGWPRRRRTGSSLRRGARDRRVGAGERPADRGRAGRRACAGAFFARPHSCPGSRAPVRVTGSLPWALIAPGAGHAWLRGAQQQADVGAARGLPRRRR